MNATDRGNTVRMACIQTCAGLDVSANLDRISDLIAQAAHAGAEFVATPEMSNVIDPDRARLSSKVGEQHEDHAVRRFAGLARQHDIDLLAGSLALKTADGRLVNRSILFGRNGAIVARYDKIHMFDVDLPGGESYRESRNYRPGKNLVVAAAARTLIGLSICYDVRFPGLYRALAQAGATILTVPAAFTVPTGEAHWEVLLRARAIETGCFVIAPAQAGTHESGRKTYGHSMIVAPWGEILAEAGVETGIVVADADMNDVIEARRRIPALQHDRDFKEPGDRLRAAS